MEITWLGHSSTRLVSGDVVLVADPSPDSPQGVFADIVAITNDGPEYSAQDRITGEPKLIDGPGQYEVRGYNIVGIGTPLEDGEGARRINTVYAIRAEGLAVCHVGALRTRLSARQLDSLGEIDVLIVPAGGGPVLEPRQVAELVNVLSPGIVIPVQTSPKEAEGGGLSAETTALFSQLNLQPPDPQPRLSVTVNNIPREMRVVLLQRSSPRRR